MIITRTITKKILENIVHETFSNFGNISSAALLDSLKFLGFYYATNAGISINIEDLKTPDLKKDFLNIASQEMTYVSEQWQQGFVSDTERFQTIIDSWNFATESLKDRIIDYYQKFDPANNLYIMAFSGARGNMSQVRQLVGMRGLMSDQEGKIIDLPIQTNFREGLSSIDYIISSYGARKGIVDTALKTADSGYLTRRLIYIAQDLVIREIDCNTTNGVIVLLKSSTSFQNIIGRHLISISSFNRSSFKSTTLFKDIALTSSLLEDLKKNLPLTLKVRSPLTCQSSGSVCQKCYGWDLAQKRTIGLGEAVGIIAAQSIGEPGTQLTMRTFHTGGIFTSELVKQTLAPFSGKIIIPTGLKAKSARTNHGVNVLKVQQEVKLKLINWKGLEEEILLEIGSFLYLTKSTFVKKGQLISEYAESATLGERKLKPIYSSFSGQVRFENVTIRNIRRNEDTKNYKVNVNPGVLWLASGKIFPFPKEVQYFSKQYLRRVKACAKLFLVSPLNGITIFKNEQISIVNNQKKIILDLSSLTSHFKNYKINFSVFIKNYQYIDQHTVLGLVNFFPNYEGKIYSTKYKESKYLKIFFLITDDDIWKINSDQINDFSYFPMKKGNLKKLVRKGMNLNANSEFSKSGYFLKKDGFKMIFQNALPIYLSPGTILNYHQNDFVFEKQILATLANYTQQTEDIVQGLPKIEDLIEARSPKRAEKAFLARLPGVFIPLENYSKREKKELDIENQDEKEDTPKFGRMMFMDVQNKIERTKTGYNAREGRVLNQDLHIFHPSLIEDLFYFEEEVYKITLINPKFYITKSDNGKYYHFTYPDSQEEYSTKKPIYLQIDNAINSSKWKEAIFKDSIIYKIVNTTENLEGTFEKSSVKSEVNKKMQGIFWKERDVSKTCFTNNAETKFMIPTKDNRYLLLEKAKPFQQYKFPVGSKSLFSEDKKSLYRPGSFIDIGEPICEGIIDPEDLLAVLFKYHSSMDGILLGTIRSVNKFQLLVVNSVQAIYQSQGVNISSKHIEIIIRQMTSKVKIEKSGDTPLLPGESIRLSLIIEIYRAMQPLDEISRYKLPEYHPEFLSSTKSSLNKDGFLSAAGFQETKKILTKAALEGTSDWLRGLKESIILGRMIPAGSAFLHYKDYLDNVYNYIYLNPETIQTTYD